MSEDLPTLLRTRCTSGNSMEREMICAAANEIERLRVALKQALRQWDMYAEMVERNDGFSLKTEKSSEGEIYRAAMALISNP